MKFFILLILFSGLAFADEPVTILEEVTVIGAVRASSAVDDINLQDDPVEDIEVVYEPRCWNW